MVGWPPSHDAVFAGFSRQTIYTQFGSRAGLAEAYALRLADRFCDVVEAAARAREDDPRTGVELAAAYSSA